MKLDPGERKVTLSNRDVVRFDKALLATGANVRRLHAEGGDLDGLHYLRAFKNADEILEDAGETERVVLVGGSFIACEVAATLTARGHECSLVMQEEITFERQFGEEIGRFFQDVLEEHGIDVNGGDELERFEGENGRVTKVVTKGGVGRVVRGSSDDGSFTAFSLDDSRVVAAITVGRSDDLDHARRMIKERATPDPNALADESTDLASL